MLEEQIILVNENDQVVGQGGKLEVHKQGLLHRAFSIFIFNSENKFLLQKRASGKYHSGGLWTNSCCGHPRVGEETLSAAKRRLAEEFGFTVDLKEVSTMTYKAPFANGLTENEFLHIFTGTFDGKPLPNPEEIEDFKWVNLNEVKQHALENPDQYTYWFKMILAKDLLTLE